MPWLPSGQNMSDFDVGWTLGLQEERGAPPSGCESDMDVPTLSPIAGLVGDKQMVLLEANVPLATSISWGLLARGKKLGNPSVDRVCPCGGWDISGTLLVARPIHHQC